MNIFLLMFYTIFVFFLGIIFYIIVRLINTKERGFVVCDSCNAIIANKKSFCSNCGVEIDCIKKLQNKKPLNRPLVILLLTLIGLLIIIIFFFILSITTAGNGMSYSQTGEDWRIELRRHNLTDEYQLTFRDIDDFFVYSSEISKGKLSLDLYDCSTREIIASLPINTADTLKNLQLNKNYKVLIKAEKATGNLAFKRL